MNQESKWPPVLISLSLKPNGATRSLEDWPVVKVGEKRAKVFQVSLMHRGRPSRVSKRPRPHGILPSNPIDQVKKYRKAVGLPQGLVNLAV
ncbi:hypothetical protein RHMOL_Rhmol01G0215300 [Rhododendron molle]|uniref:Uncharacterized protein n=1 Tax=Rhododendron molle TaxID=49168 RepID=A0ACC0Q3P3_RHOML|nr:hypothetical protein RHMOL_Rhmol01G0215300 [Rhododendron molle]